MKKSDAEKLRRALSQMNIETTREICENLVAFLDALRAANCVLNLSRDADVPDALERVILDSLSPLSMSSLIPRCALVCDIGSGAGLPGVPLAIARPDISVRAIESIAKKCAFIQNVCAELHTNVTVVNARAEEYSARFRGEADVCVCRAVSSLPVILEYASPMLARGGKLVAFKAEKAEEEISASASALARLQMEITQVIDVDIPQTDWNHKLIIATQTGECPTIFPRRAGVAESRSL